MKKKTDLPKVKATARALLLTGINETEFSPVILSHPFIHRLWICCISKIIVDLKFLTDISKVQDMTFDFYLSQ